MSDSGGGGGGGGCFRWCFRLILTSSFTVLFLWLFLRASKPTCSIEQFYVPALNPSANSTTNQAIYLDLKLNNPNSLKGIYYDPFNLTIYYGPTTILPIANYIVPGFYQGHKRNTRRRGLVETRGVPWEAAFGAGLNGSVVVFRVDLSTAVRFKTMVWKTKRQRMVVGTNVEVYTGKKVEKKGIKLKSSAPETGCYCARLGPVVVFSVFVLVFI